MMAVPPAPGTPATDRPLFVGVDIGGTTTQLLCCTPGLEVLTRVEVPTPAREGGHAMMDAVLRGADDLLRSTPGRLVGVGVGAAGVVDAEAGRILVASNSFTDWAGYAVTERIERELGVPACLDNDVNAFLRGEVSAGAAVGHSDVLGMTLGTGVGGALWMSGALYGGPHGAAGEIGHIPGFGDVLCSCGEHGHLETRSSGWAIAANYLQRRGERMTAKEVADRARAGDAAAAAAYRDAGAALGQAIVVTAGLIDVTTVVIGGGVSRAWDLLEPAIRERIVAEPPVSGHEVTVMRAALGSDAVAIGAVSRAIAALAA